MAEIEKAFRSLLDGKYASLSISFNEHASNYETVEQWEISDGRANWLNDHERDDAIANDSVWLLQFYPYSPVGFVSVCASSLSALIEFAEKYDG